MSCPRQHVCRILIDCAASPVRGRWHSVLLGIVEVGGVPEVAEALGVSAETVKTNLSHLYEKTGVNRQADLVKLVAGFSNPFVT